MNGGYLTVFIKICIVFFMGGILFSGCESGPHPVPCENNYVHLGIKNNSQMVWYVSITEINEDSLYKRGETYRMRIEPEAVVWCDLKESKYGKKRGYVDKNGKYVEMAEPPEDVKDRSKDKKWVIFGARGYEKEDD